MLTIDKEIAAYEKRRAGLSEVLIREDADPNARRHEIEEMLMVARSADHMPVRRLALAALRPRPEYDASVKDALHEALFNAFEDLTEDNHGHSNS